MKITYLLAYSMQQIASWEANQFPVNQEISRILWNPKVQSQVPATCPYIGAARPSPQPHIALPEDPS